MNSSIRRQVFVIALVALLLFSYSTLIAEPVSFEQVQKATETFFKAQEIRLRKGSRTLSITAQGQTTSAEPTLAGFREICSDDPPWRILAYVAELSPCGFIVTSTDTDITPIIAYSLISSFPAGENGKNPLLGLLKEDMSLRLQALAEYDQSKKIENNNLWNLYADEDIGYFASDTFQQWPQENTTSTGGWLETAWDQGPPYNDFCPLDPVDGNRSYVGCVATALAQVVNYHQQCSVSFDELDSYTTYASVNIDEDCHLYDFPSFEQLNEYLATVRLKYSRQTDLDDTDIAALSFACGVACFMDYSSEGSGASTYDAQEALVDKLGFYSADMTGGLSGEYYYVLQENIINGLPAVMGIGPPDGYGGHAIVCDGYNTNGEYHLNFGWGSSSPDEMTEAWYRLPTDMPIRDYVIMETILNVQPVPPSISIDPVPSMFYGLPGQETEPKTLFIKNNSAQSITINSISSPEGFVVSRSDNGYTDYIDSFQIQRPGQEASINIKFCPDEAQSYYGTLAIDYGESSTKHVILKGCSFDGGTEIQEGQVFGTWTDANSPYFVYGDINVPENETLVIEPGVKVMFVGPYGLTIGENAQLIAEGDENHLIEFTAWNKEVGWTGLRFLDSADDDVLSYCSLTFSKKNTGLTTLYEYYYGEEDEDNCGGAVYCYASSPTITNCKITNNIGDKGGAIYCTEGYPIISNTLIANNASMGGSFQCGGVCTENWGTPEIKNCTIVNNSPGGVYTESEDGVDIINTIIWGNDIYQIQTYWSVPVVSFCDVQGGYPGEGNMSADPCFFAPSSGAGPDYDGLSANWTLRSCSPCINSGTEIYLPATDLAGSPRIYCDIVDIGAYENQSDLPLMTVAPSIDAGFVRLGTDSTVGFDITNTGEMEFTIESLSVSNTSRNRNSQSTVLGTPYGGRLTAEPNGVFSIITDGQNYILAPGDSLWVEIGFAPIEEKKYTSTLYIHSTSSNAPDKQIALHGVGVSGTIVSSDTVSGSWKKAESPYTITGNIHVPRGRTLNIEPGVVVKFTGHFGLTVGYRATLQATGTQTEPIVFTATDTDEGWFGIRFVNSGSDDTLEYCDIEYSNKSITTGNNYLDLCGGGILCCSSWEAEPMYGIASSPTIDHCLIANNYAFSGGGIMCVDDSEAEITNNTIVDNSVYYYGGGIYVEEASPTIANNVIAHNSAWDSGGILIWYCSGSITNNTIVHNRPNGLYLGPVTWSFWGSESPPILNNIIWQNEIYVSDYVYDGDYDICYNNIQGGLVIEGEEQGEGNIDIDPLFADPDNRDYHLKSQAGRWDPASQSWVQDDVTSPCIDAGDPDSDWTAEPSPNGKCVNMGAFGGTPEASKSVN